MPRLEPNASIVREGNGEPLVLLHCLGVDHHFWDFAKPLASDFTLYRYDLPGHGTSAVPAAGYEIRDLSEQLAGIMRAQRIDRAGLVGISLGGLIAQDFAAQHPDRVSRLILIDTTPRYTDEMRAMWAERAAIARSKGVATLVDGLLKIWFSDGALEEDTEAVRFVRATLARCDGEGYALACEALAQADLRDCAPRIKAPTLILCGDGDIPSFLDAARWLAAHIAEAKLCWVAGTRHASVLETPQEAMQLIRTFFRTTGDPRPER
ncbi:MAG: alpha/beta fold hydrolase [Bradyrhizobiaceae bacterium]|nr:alpha/beta fold hydrolase [Bradyrhizobiaceae bacterium]